MNADLPRPAHPPKVSGEQFYNTFACDALISNGNELYDPPSNKGKAYTDTDSDGKTEIITDITCKFKGKPIAMEAKVDPGSETNCIPLSHFRRMFPQLCKKDGTPKENALEPTLAQFEAYDGGIMTSHGWIILPTRDIRDSNKFHPVRYYVVTMRGARSQTSTLGLYLLYFNFSLRTKNKLGCPSFLDFVFVFGFNRYSG